MGLFPFFTPPILGSQNLMHLESMPSLGQCTGTWGARSAGIAWATANLAMYFPFRLFKPVTISIVSLFHGATVNGNGDCGIFSEDGTRLTSTGSVAINSAANGSFDFEIPDITLGRGNYYIGLATDSTTHTYKGTPIANVTVQMHRVMGVLQQGTAFPLPATMTPALCSLTFLPQMFWQMQLTQHLMAMGDDIYLPPPRTIHPWCLESLGGEITCKAGSALKDTGSAVWVTANAVVLTPFWLSAPTRIQRLFCHNGGAVSGNVDMGIYAAAPSSISQLGVRLVSSGSTPMSGTNVLQVFNTDVTLGPGMFYMALACDNITAQFFRGTVDSTALFGLDGSGAIARAASFPLPATIQLSNDLSKNYIPVFGCAQGTVV